MDNDLERSMRFLEDALSTPKRGLFRPSAKQKKPYTPNLSLTLQGDEYQNLLHKTHTSIFLDATSTLESEDQSMLGSIIQSGAPWKSTLNNLHSEFAEILQGEQDDVIATAAELARCCSDALSVIQSLKSKVSSQSQDEKWLECERNSWRLLYVLYQNRLQSAPEDTLPVVGGSEKVCVDLLYKKDALIREAQLIVDWLERNAGERGDPILLQSDWTYGWEHTLHQLVAPESIAIGSNVRTVKSIHPDAPQFEGLSLHHLDRANEKELCRRIFAEIRCGRLEAAQELCYNSGHPWRAAILEGWRLYHNPNIKDIDVDEEMSSDVAILEPDAYEDVEGNLNRDLWKSNALNYCKQTNLDQYERAAVASLCGCLDTLLPVCTSWEDHLWAYMKTMIDLRVESEIRDTIVRDYVKLPEEYWEQRMSLNEIFALLESSRSESVRNESLDREHLVQKFIILDDTAGLIEKLAEWSGNEGETTHSLRFYAHLILFLDGIGDAPNRPRCETIIEAYIQRLSEMEETQLVALYVSKLSQRKQIEIYANHVERITDNEDRKLSLSFAEEQGLDVFSITKTVVENVRSRPFDEDPSRNLQGRLTASDESKISALDWLTFYEDQRVEALTQTNALVFKFLALRKLDGAVLALNKIPLVYVEKIHGDEHVSLENKMILKEFLSYKSYLDAHEEFNGWFKQYRSRPTPPSELPDSAQFTEKVAHQHRVSQHKAEVERWKLTTSDAAQRTISALYNVLLFPEGWLSGSLDDEYLRAVCIPEVVLLLYSVLSETDRHQEAVQLADLVASEKYCLYRVYSKEKLGELLEKLAESSVALLNAKKDPWGNPNVA